MTALALTQHSCNAFHILLVIRHKAAIAFLLFGIGQAFLWFP